MGKTTRNRKEKVPKLTEEEYASYVMKLRGELPTEGLTQGNGVSAVKEEIKTAEIEEELS